MGARKKMGRIGISIDDDDDVVFRGCNGHDVVVSGMDSVDDVVVKVDVAVRLDDVVQ